MILDPFAEITRRKMTLDLTGDVTGGRVGKGGGGFTHHTEELCITRNENKKLFGLTAENRRPRISNKRRFIKWLVLVKQERFL